MKGVSAVVLCFLLAACSSAKKADDVPSEVPPPQPVTTTPSDDARIAALETSMTELLDRLDVLNARIAKLEAGGTVAGAPARSAAGDAPSTPPPAQPRTGAVNIPELYRQALILYGEGKHAEARAAFQRVFDADPGNTLADNALFWIGETYYASGDYPNAMRFYQRVIREYADQNKAPDAMFKLGMAYVKTGDLGMARKTLQECVEKYPYSAPASSAKLELKRISY